MTIRELQQKLHDLPEDLPVLLSSGSTFSTELQCMQVKNMQFCTGHPMGAWIHPDGSNENLRKVLVLYEH